MAPVPDVATVVVLLLAVVVNAYLGRMSMAYEALARKSRYAHYYCHYDFYYYYYCYYLFFLLFS